MSRSARFWHTISKISDTEYTCVVTRAHALQLGDVAPCTAPGFYIKQLTRGGRARGRRRGGKRRARAKGAQWHVRHRGNGHGLAGGINDHKTNAGRGAF